MKASAAALVLSWSLSGCTTATIRLAEGPPIEADIEGGTESSITVFGDHGRREIPRREIVDVDHPGDGQMVAGAIMLGIGALAIAGGACSNQPEDTDPQGKASCTLALVPGGLGFANLLVGLVINTQSRNALADTSLKPSEARLRLVRVPPPPPPAQVSGTDE